MHTWYLSFFYTDTFWGLKILHSYLRKFATKITSRQNSVKLHIVYKITHCVLYYTQLCNITNCVTNYKCVCYPFCVKLHTVSKITHFVENYTLSAYLPTVCKIAHNVWNNTLYTKLHRGLFRVQYGKIPLTWNMLHWRRRWRQGLISGMNHCH